MKNKQLFTLASLLLTLGLLFGTFSSYAQCDSLTLTSPDDIIILRGESPGEPAFFKSITLNAKVAGTYKLSLTPMLGKDDIIRFEPDKLDIEPETIQLKQGQGQAVDLVLRGINAAGFYRSSLRLTPANEPECEALSMPLEVHLYDDNQLEIDGSALLEVKTTASDWLNFLLPKNITEDTLLVAVRNKSNLPLKLDRYSLLLTGALNRRAITDSGINPDLAYTLDSLPAGGAGILRFPLPARSSMVPDRYDGDLQLKFEHIAQPVTLPVKLSARQAPLWPIVFLILGILLGRMFRSLDAAQDQITLFETLSPLKRDIEEMTNTGVRSSLLREYKGISRAIEKVKNAKEAEPVAARIASLEKKISYLRDLDEIEAALDRSGGEISAEIRGLLLQIRKVVLEGNFTKAEQLQLQLKDAVNKITVRTKGTLPRGGLDLDPRGAPASLHPDSLRNINTTIDLLPTNEKSTDDQDVADTTGPIEKFMQKVLQFLSGVDIGIGVKYWFYRPLALSVLFVFILLIGFKEIYIDGGDYFGANGLFDYAQLFTWGLASDLFTRELIGKQLIGLKSNFLGKKADAAENGDGENS